MTHKDANRSGRGNEPEDKLDANERMHNTGAKIVSNLLITAIIANVVAIALAVLGGDAQSGPALWIGTIIEWVLKATLALSASGLVLLAGALIRPGVMNIPWTATLTAATLLSAAGVWIW